jgi:hypothetical protein
VKVHGYYAEAEYEDGTTERIEVRTFSRAWWAIWLSRKIAELWTRDGKVHHLKDGTKVYRDASGRVVFDDISMQ